MNKKYIIKASVLVLIALIGTPVAQAEVAAVKPLAVTPIQPNTGTNSALFRQLDELRSQNAVLAESLKNAELKNKILSAGQNPTGAIGLSPGSTGPGSSASSSAQVLLVSGSGNNLTALISLPSGGRVTARVGSHILGLGVVKSIAVNEVVVASKTQTIILPFASDPSSASIGAGIPSGMPGMMPGGAR